MLDKNIYKIVIMLYFAFGFHTVSCLLSSPFFSFKKVLALNKYKEKKELVNLLKKKNICHFFLTKEEFSRFTFNKKNQGIVVFIDSYFYISLEKLLSRKTYRQYPFFLLLDGLQDPQNFGTIIRTAAALQIDGIIIGEKKQVSVNNTVINVSSGGIAFVPICKVFNLLWAVEKLKTKNFCIYSTVCNSFSTSYCQINSFSFPLCVILGSEGAGVSKSLLKKSDQLIYVPVFEKINSLNVSVCCGIVCSWIINWQEKNKKLI